MANTINIKLMASRLGVSTATISNAFNKPDQLSKHLRQKILKEAEELGYNGANLAARYLRRGQSNVIGVVLSDSLSYSFSDSVASQLLKGVAKVLAEHRKHMLLLSSEADSDEQRLAQSLPDAFIFYGTKEYGTIEKPAVERLAKTGKPIVLVDFYLDNTSSINIDNEQAAYSVAKHALYTADLEIAVLGLKLLNFNRICRLSAKDLDSDYREITRTRLNGFIKAAEDANCKINAESIWHIPTNSNAEAEIAAKEALEKSPRPRVLLCMSDVIALSAIKVAKQLGLSVPGDVIVTGFDGIPESDVSVPSLTTICQNSEKKGELAAELLFSQNINKQIIVETTLLIRDSTSK